MKHIEIDVTDATVRRGIIRLLTDPHVLDDCDEADSCPCRACRYSEPVRPTITERVMRWKVERVTEWGLVRMTTASELWKAYEYGRPAHYIAIGSDGRIACTTWHQGHDNGCADAVSAILATKLNAALAAEE